MSKMIDTGCHYYVGDEDCHKCLWKGLVFMCSGCEVIRAEADPDTKVCYNCKWNVPHWDENDKPIPSKCPWDDDFHERNVHTDYCSKFEKGDGDE